MRSRKTLPDNIDLSLPSNACFNLATEDMAGETWLPIFENKNIEIPKIKKNGVLYVISNYGRVKKISPSGEKILSQTLSKSDNLPQFFISEEAHFTHKTVAKVFEVPNALNLPELGHINGVPWDNRPDNLEYCEINTDFILFPYTTCNYKLMPKGTAYHNPPIVKTTEEGHRIAGYLNTKIAAENCDIHQRKIQSLSNSKGTHEGFIWMNLREYVHLPRFVKQAAFIVNEDNKKHPWLL